VKQLTCLNPLSIRGPFGICGDEIAVDALTDHSILLRAACETGGAGRTHIHLIEKATDIRLARIILATPDK
jgi:hypothetical protein